MMQVCGRCLRCMVGVVLDLVKFLVIVKRVNGKLTEQFGIETETRQECFMSPWLFIGGVLRKVVQIS